MGFELCNQFEIIIQIHWKMQS